MTLSQRMYYTMPKYSFMVAVIAISGCSGSGGSPPRKSTINHATAMAPVFHRPAHVQKPAANVRDAATQSSTKAKEPIEKTVEAAAPTTMQAATTPAEPTPPTSDTAVANEGAIQIEVKNVGMHIGGAKNTTEEKRPIRADIKVHYPAFRQCYLMATNPPEEVLFGIDMHLRKGGGLARMSHPRSGLKSRKVSQCLLEVFQTVEFSPLRVDKVISFSIRLRKIKIGR